MILHKKNTCKQTKMLANRKIIFLKMIQNENLVEASERENDLKSQSCVPILFSKILLFFSRLHFPLLVQSDFFFVHMKFSFPIFTSQSYIWNLLCYILIDCSRLSWKMCIFSAYGIASNYTHHTQNRLASLRFFGCVCPYSISFVRDEPIFAPFKLHRSRIHSKSFILRHLDL